MAHPYINQEVKGAFRWYRSPALRHRSRLKPTEESAPEKCIAALAFPFGTILPFQIRCAYGTASVQSWLVKDLSGATVVNLSASIPLLVISDFASPDRGIICMEEVLRLTTLPTGEHEMEITTSTGEVLYSETFEWMCPKTGDLLTNSDLSSGFTNWSYGQWAGRLSEILAGSGPPPTSGSADYNQVATLGDNLLWSWNGSTWTSSTPSNGSYWGVDPTIDFLVFSGGGWATPVTMPVIPSDGGMCWQGNAGVHWAFAVPASPLPSYLQLRFTVFYGGGGIVGSVGLYVGNALVGTYSNAQNGSEQTVTVWVEPGDVVEFIPSSNFTGCIQGTAFNVLDDGTGCMTRMEWWDCGDLGTVAYSIGNGGFSNILYVRDQGCSSGAIYDPTPNITEEPQTDANGASVQARRRKEVDWKLEMEGMPWHVIDALSEMVVSGSRTIRAPWSGGEDEIMTARLETSWTNKWLTASATLTFTVDEATVASGCCDLFPRPCPEPCGEAVGIYGIHEPEVGMRYLYINGTIATYCSLECEEPVDQDGFNEITECAARLATTTDPDYPLMRWDGVQWVIAVGIDSVAVDEGEPRLVTVTASIPSGYSGQIEASSNGTDYVDQGAVYSAAELAGGVEVLVPEGTQYVRVVALGHDCELGTSLPAPMPGACPFIVFTSNLQSLCGSLPQAVTVNATPYAEEGGQSLDMFVSNETVRMYYRLDGGAWNELEVQVNTGYYAITGIPYTTAGVTLEVRIEFVDRPWCSDQVSDAEECEA